MATTPSTPSTVVATTAAQDGTARVLAPIATSLAPTTTTTTGGGAGDGGPLSPTSQLQKAKSKSDLFEDIKLLSRIGRNKEKKGNGSGNESLADPRVDPKDADVHTFLQSLAELCPNNGHAQQLLALSTSSLSKSRYHGLLNLASPLHHCLALSHHICWIGDVLRLESLLERISVDEHQCNVG
jgi:hypothetical protein